LNTLLFDVERIRDFLVTMSSLSTYLITVIFITTTSNVPVHFCRWWCSTCRWQADHDRREIFAWAFGCGRNSTDTCRTSWACMSNRNTALKTTHHFTR